MGVTASDATKSTEVIVALSADRKEKVDEIVNKALAAGGKASNEPDLPRLYVWMEFSGYRRSSLGVNLYG